MNSDGLWGLLITGSLYVADETAPVGRKKIVFQRTHPDFGNLPRPGPMGMQRRAHVIPYDPKTPYQLALRARFAAATAAWQAADESIRETYRTAACGLRHTGFNEWVSEWCAAHVLNPADYSGSGQYLRPFNQWIIGGAPFPMTFIAAGTVTLNLA